MTTKYAPSFKDKNGNRMIPLASNVLFDTYQEASDFALGQSMFMIPFGLTFAGTTTLTFGEDGSCDLRHFRADHAQLGEFAIFEGPALDEEPCVEAECSVCDDADADDAQREATE